LMPAYFSLQDARGGEHELLTADVVIYEREGT